MQHALTVLLLALSLAVPPEKAPETAPEKPTPKAPEKPTPKAPENPPPKAPEKPTPKPPTVVTANDILHVKPQEGLPRQKYRIFGEEYDCELCLDTESRNAGMGARTEFPAKTAMIFVHPYPGLITYWMKDCLIDMDIVMLDSQGIICAMHEATREKLRTKDETLEAYHNRLHRYASGRRVKYIIEFPAGTLARVKPILGQRIDIDWKSLDARTR